MTDQAQGMSWSRRLVRPRLASAVAILALQTTAAIYFVADSVEDVLSELQSGLTLSVAMECIVSAALAAGVYLGSRYVGQLARELRRSELALSLAKGALSEHIELKFREWRLSASEAEIAMLALKGFQPPEIAKLRGAAAGTVRSQLSQVYAKAGVTSHSMLLASFIEDLL